MHLETDLTPEQQTSSERHAGRMRSPRPGFAVRGQVRMVDFVTRRPVSGNQEFTLHYRAQQVYTPVRLLLKDRDFLNKEVQEELIHTAREYFTKKMREDRVFFDIVGPNRWLVEVVNFEIREHIPGIKTFV